jgi:hypothetical protein
MTEKKETKASKRPYHKMRMEGVQLVAEEAVLAGCKTSGSSGPDAGACNVKGGSGKCSAPLS